VAANRRCCRPAGNFRSAPSQIGAVQAHDQGTEHGGQHRERQRKLHGEADHGHRLGRSERQADRGPDVPPALLAIQEAGADATRELRATLSVLRSEDDCDREDGDGSGLGQLNSLVARARVAGLPVSVTVTGAQRQLPAGVDQAAYRIVQEALTNVSRHAGGACATVHLHYGQDVLTVQVNDDGSGVSTVSAGPGLGLIGMRERVSALGGKLDAGPRAGGGFRVRAELPARAAS